MRIRFGSRGFTLIELLLVMLIIAILLAFLMPAVGTVRRAMKIRETERRVNQLNTYVELYKTVFNDYPLSMMPSGSNYNYPPFYRGNKGYGVTDQAQWGLGGYPGGLYLVYFLLGPEGGGWRKSTYPTISAEWKAPDGLAGMVCDRLIGLNSENPYRAGYFFEDAFGYDGIWYNGLIQYARADTRQKNPAKRFGRYDMYSPYYWSSTRGYCHGDGPDANIQRLTAQTTMPFVIVAPGPDHLLGYYVWDDSLQAWRADASKGMTDDICNFQHD